MLKHDPKIYWPSAEELPDSDDTPVDNELQDLIPGLLKAILACEWETRMDWFFGVDMGIYYDPEKPPIVPDGFLSLGVERIFDEELRPSYAIWEEEQVPLFVLEVVSQTYRGEYSTKKQQYAELGVLYYAVYSSRRRRKPHLEVHHLVNNDTYELLSGQPIWLPEVGLGLGCDRGTYQGILREWVYWYDEQGNRLRTPEERAQEALQLAQREQQLRQEAESRLQDTQRQMQRLVEQLRSLGIEPDTLS